jgi:hypothetical protein
MWQIRTPVWLQSPSRGAIEGPRRPGSDVRALQNDAERAGLAWACPFASSAEFEAAVVKSRRRAGAYRLARVRRYAVQAAVLAAAAAMTAGTYFLTWPDAGQP